MYFGSYFFDSKINSKSDKVPDIKIIVEFSSVGIVTNVIPMDPHNSIMSLYSFIVSLVLSNKIDRDVKAQMEYFFKDIFTEAIGESPLVGKKPGTKGIEYIKEKYNLKNDEIIYVGDSHVDMEFSKNAQLKVIACMYGYERIYNIMDYHPDFIINNPKELLDIL